jgi:hypothetical protein
MPRFLRASTLPVTLSWLFAACRGTGAVVAGPVDITSTPQQVTFLGPVPVAGLRRELCFDFDPPGESHKAGQLQAVLIATDGRRDSLIVARIDRRGEARVCLIAADPAPTQQARLAATRYRAVELWAITDVHVRTLRWWSGP